MLLCKPKLTMYSLVGCRYAESFGFFLEGTALLGRYRHSFTVSFTGLGNNRGMHWDPGHKEVDH